MNFAAAAWTSYNNSDEKMSRQFGYVFPIRKFYALMIKRRLVLLVDHC